jgi:hypothetical protein
VKNHSAPVERFEDLSSVQQQYLSAVVCGALYQTVYSGLGDERGCHPVPRFRAPVLCRGAIPMNYVARKPCGCIVGAVSQDAPKSMVASALANWIRAGFVIDRVTDDVVRAEFQGQYCQHTPRQMALFDEEVRLEVRPGR